MFVLAAPFFNEREAESRVMFGLETNTGLKLNRGFKRPFKHSQKGIFFSPPLPEMYVGFIHTGHKLWTAGKKMPVRFNCVYFLQSRHHSAAARRSFPHKHKNSLTHKLLISFLSLRRFSLDGCSAAAGETQHVLHIKRRRRVMKEKTRG